jgi:glycosyl transferase family 2
MSQTQQPLVSCIMPTRNRREWVKQAIARFQQQTYENRELVIADDSERGLAPEGFPYFDEKIRYHCFYPNAFKTLGEKRNFCIRVSMGSLIMHWDDDDFHGANRIAFQVRALLNSKADICGLKSLIYEDTITKKWWLYTYNGARPWLAGGTFLYTREFWKQSPFPDQQIGSDTAFLWAHKGGRRVVINEPEFYVARIHGSNTSPIEIKPPAWQPFEMTIEKARQLMTVDGFRDWWGRQQVVCH